MSLRMVAWEVICDHMLAHQILYIDVLFEDFCHDVLMLSTVECVEHVSRFTFEWQAAVVFLKLSLNPDLFSIFLYDSFVKKEDYEYLVCAFELMTYFLLLSE